MFTLRNLILSTLILLSISNKLFAQFTNATFLDDKIRFSESRGLDYDAPTDALFYNGYNNGRVVKLGDPSGNGWFMGFLGIGTNNPKTTLDLGGLRLSNISSFPAEGSIVEGTWGNYIIGNINTGQELRLGVVNDSYTRAEIKIDNNNRADGKIFFKTTDANGGALTRMFISGNGRVGIGTENPSANLDIIGLSGAMSKMHISNAVPGSAQGFLDINMGTTDIYAAGLKAYVPSGQPGIDRVFLGLYTTTYDGGLQTRAERMTITDKGYVGIGTQAPVNVLQVEGATQELNFLLKNTSVPNGARTYITSFADKSSIQTDKNFSIRTLNGSIWQDQVTVTSDGNVAIGTSDPKGYKLAVAGKTISEEVVVKLQGSWPDYVFSNNYNLRSLDEVEKFIKENNHLPEVPSEKEVKENGVNVGEMNAILLKKIEELTLYVIELKKENEEIKKKLELK